MAVITEIALVVELEQEAANGDDIKLAVVGDKDLSLLVIDRSNELVE